MKKEKLYKKFFKLGCKIDNEYFHKIEFDLVDNTIHSLWLLVKEDNINNLHNFVKNYFKVNLTVEKAMVECFLKINSTEFMDTRLLNRVRLKNKFNKLKSMQLELDKFEQEFLIVFGVSIAETNQYLQTKEL